MEQTEALRDQLEVREVSRENIGSKETIQRRDKSPEPGAASGKMSDFKTKESRHENKEEKSKIGSPPVFVKSNNKP